ncbi:hypothetical protein SAMN05444272_3252 [Roseibium suaedae]|uniref:Uncharacterized protein n=1 Tax=Roseibium suaedae TaxID=735517 RepID=A0A1M7LNV2_9HYPH|nr:hypothetical protein SAMN05444272_3252 [Roseibium suaedae]
MGSLPCANGANAFEKFPFPCAVNTPSLILRNREAVSRRMGGKQASHPGRPQAAARLGDRFQRRRLSPVKMASAIQTITKVISVVGIKGSFQTNTAMMK